MTDVNDGLGTTVPSLVLTHPSSTLLAITSSTVYNVGQGMVTGDSENLGNGTINQFNQMVFLDRESHRNKARRTGSEG